MGAFGHGGVAEVDHRLGLAARVGGVGEEHAELHHLRVGEHAQQVAAVGDARRLEGELLRACHLAEGVFEEGGGEARHLVAAAFDVDEGFGRQGLAVDADGERVVMPRPHGEGGVLDGEAEGRGALVDGAVVDDALRRFGDHLRGNDEQQRDECQGRQSVLEVAAVGLEVDGVGEGHGAQLFGLLLDGGEEERGVLSVKC